MLDFELAELYGYTTKNFNRQVKNNIAKFEGDDFMFQLNDAEVENLSRCNFCTFKQMKDYIISNQNLIGEREYLQLSMQIADNLRETRVLRSDLDDVEDKMAAAMERLGDVVTHSELSKVMNEFGEPHVKRGYLILNGQPFKADVAYSEIYGRAKTSIYVVDNYIGIKTLAQMVNVNKGIKIKIFSDNLAKGLNYNFRRL